jgi:hypothetical protein
MVAYSFLEGPELDCRLSDNTLRWDLPGQVGGLTRSSSPKQIVAGQFTDRLAVHGIVNIDGSSVIGLGLPQPNTRGQYRRNLDAPFLILRSANLGLAVRKTVNGEVLTFNIVSMTIRGEH